VTLGVSNTHHLGYRGGVDLHRVDLEIRQPGMAGQPFGQYLQPERSLGVLLVGQLGIGDQYQWVQFHRAAAGARAHTDVFRIIGQQVAVDHQGSQQIVQLQPAAAAQQRSDLR
jgi:hypothetical protein